MDRKENGGGYVANDGNQQDRDGYLHGGNRCASKERRCATRNGIVILTIGDLCAFMISGVGAAMMTDHDYENMICKLILECWLKHMITVVSLLGILVRRM